MKAWFHNDCRQFCYKSIGIYCLSVSSPFIIWDPRIRLCPVDFNWISGNQQFQTIIGSLFKIGRKNS